MKVLQYETAIKLAIALLLFQCCATKYSNKRDPVQGTYDSSFTFFQLVNYKYLSSPARSTPIMTMELHDNQSFKMVSCGRDLTGTWVQNADTLHLKYDQELYHVPLHLTYRKGKWRGKAYYNNRQIMYSFMKNETQE